VLGYQLAQGAIVADAVFEKLVGGPLQLRPVEYTVLMLVKQNPGGSPAQLSKALALTRPNVSLQLDRLEARGLVTRRRNVNDRRGQHLHVSDAGAALVLRATRLLIEGERQAFTTLSVVEQLMLTELLHKLACARGAEMRPAPRPPAAATG